MRLLKVMLRNFRCYKEETWIDIGELTALIGRNDSGKSSIMDALEIFFDDKVPDAGDGSIGGDKSKIEIACVFDKLPSSVVIDADYPTTLENEHLLNAEGMLEIHKVYKGDLKTPKVARVFAAAQHPTADGVNDLLTLTNANLKKRAKEVGVDTKAIDLKINTQIRKSIWDAADDLKIEAAEIELSESGARPVWDQLKKHMPTFSLFKSDRKSSDQDDEVQDPMKAAVKEAIKSKAEELDAIAEHVEKEVINIANLTVKKIREMDPELASELVPDFTRPNWATGFKISLAGDEEIPINKRGSGVRRLILLNFFRAKAEEEAKATGSSGIIYAIEEPETSQHPDNQKLLMETLQELSEEPDCQVIITTHTPMLGRFLPVESLRYVEVCDDKTRKIHEGDDDTYEMVAKALGVLPDNGVRLFIGVEGKHDINHLKIIAKVLLDACEDVPDLAKLDEEGKIIFIPVGGSNVQLWVSRLKELKRPEYHIFDRDTEPPDQPHYHKEIDGINAQENCEAKATSKLELENYLHHDAIKEAREEVDIEFGDFDDVPELAAKALHDASESENEWGDLDEECKRKKLSTAKKWLNTTAVENMTAERLTERDPDGDVRSWLSDIKAVVEKDG
jgi:putative ATP-dependent endonuclease of OLD family